MKSLMFGMSVFLMSTVIVVAADLKIQTIGNGHHCPPGDPSCGGVFTVPTQKVQSTCSGHYCQEHPNDACCNNTFIKKPTVK